MLPEDIVSTTSVNAYKKQAGLLCIINSVLKKVNQPNKDFHFQHYEMQEEGQTTP